FITSLLTIPRPPRPPLFPYTTLFRSLPDHRRIPHHARQPGHRPEKPPDPGPVPLRGRGGNERPGSRTPALRSSRWPPRASIATGDRKSTRLNSSHQIISYAVFCLKKK